MPPDARDGEPRDPSARRAIPGWYAAVIAVVLALGCVQFWPSLESGLFADDYVMIAAIDGKLGAPRGALDLFNFVDGTPEDIRALQRLGSIAWWAAPDLRVSFLRPLSSALVHLDLALFGKNVSAYHAHSIFAWALLIVAATLLYARLFSSFAVAALATAFFALDQSHHGPVVWVCNRGALYALLLGVLGLAAHLRFRTRGERAGAWLSALCFGSALLFGEWAIPMFGYVLAFELAGARDGYATRFLAVLPAAALGVVFLGVRAVLGYGARGSGIYVDPGSDPLGFALLLLHRIPVFVADLAFNLPSHHWDQGSRWRERVLELELIPPAVWVELPSWRFYHVLIGLAAIFVVFAALRWCWRGLDRDERVTLRFLLLGALFSLVPVAGSFPSTRLTLAASFGLAPAFALVLRQVGRRLLEAPRLSLPRFFAVYLLGVAVLHVQLLGPLQEDVQSTADYYGTSREWVLAAELDPRQVANQRVFVLNAAEFTTTFFFAYTWTYHDRPLPRSFVPLSMAPYAHDLERIAPNVLLLRTLGGAFFSAPAEVHYRTRDRPLRLHEALQVDGVRIEVAREISGEPQTLRLTFDRPVDDPSYVFLTSTPTGLARFAMPEVGGSARLRRASGPNWFALDRARHERRIGPFPATLAFTPLPAFVDFDPD